jgi:uncharacterized protein (UPF0276 family)
VTARSAPAPVVPLTGDGDVIGVGWRPETAALALTRPDIEFVEVVAEAMPRGRSPLPVELEVLIDRGVPVVPHGVRLCLGGAERPDRRRLDALADLARRVRAPLVSEHLAFVRAGPHDAGHLLPLPRTRQQLAVVVDNIRRAQDRLPVPLALEPVASLLAWPGAELDEAAFITEVLDRTGALLLLDVANLVVNAANHGFDAEAALAALPLERLAYVHIAGGTRFGGLAHDTHAHPVWPEALDLLTRLAAQVPAVPVLLERDDRFPGSAALGAELDRIAGALAAARHPGASPPSPERCTPAAGTVRTRPHGRAPGSGGGSDRRQVGAAQRSLVRALLGGGAVPAGFDPHRLTATAHALRHKRAREMAKAWPGFAAAYGDRFEHDAATWLTGRPFGRSSAADGAAFLHARTDRAVSPGARAEILLARARFTVRGRPRRRRLGLAVTRTGAAGGPAAVLVIGRRTWRRSLRRFRRAG